MMDIDKEIKIADQALYELYQGGSVDTPQINRLWARVERLEQIKAEGLE